MSSATYKVDYVEGFVPLPRADLPVPASTARCTSFVSGACLLKGHCPNRDRRNPKKCLSGGKAEWCGLELRRRGK